MMNSTNSDGSMMTINCSPESLAQALAEEMPEVEYTVITQEDMEIDMLPVFPRLYFFCMPSSACQRIELLFWDSTDFWLCYKRLEKGTFGN